MEGLIYSARRQRLYIKENNKFLSWKVKVKDLLSKVCGEDSDYLREFDKFDKNEFGIQTTESNYQIFLRLEAVFLAAKEDFEAGYLLPLRTLIQAEIFFLKLNKPRNS